LECDSSAQGEHDTVIPLTALEAVRLVIKNYAVCCFLSLYFNTTSLYN